jgi:hypothetical protein
MNEFGDDLDGAVDVAVVLIVLHNPYSHARVRAILFVPGARYSNL